MNVDKSEWQGAQGDSWANEWRRTDRSFGMVTEKLLGWTRGKKFGQILDIGCGAGELALALARGRRNARILGVDISPALVATARERGAHLTNANFDLADAARWVPHSGFSPELLISRHGVMFFDDPPAAFRNLSNIAHDDAQLLFSCFRSPAENPFFTEVMKLLPPSGNAPDPEAPGPFAFARKERIEDILTKGGWRQIVCEPIDFAMIVGGGADPVEDAVSYFSSIGPAAVVARSMSEPDRQEFLAKLRELARANLDDGLVSMSAAGWIVTAKKA